MTIHLVHSKGILYRIDSASISALSHKYFALHNGYGTVPNQKRLCTNIDIHTKLLQEAVSY